MDIVRGILGVILFLVSVGLIVVVLLQRSKGEGLGAIGGGGHLFFGAETGIDAFLSKVTKYLAIVFLLLAIVASAIGVLA